MATRKSKNELSVVETAPGTSIVGETDKEGNKVVNFEPIFPVMTGRVRIPEIDIQRIAQEALKLAAKDNYEGGWTSYFTRMDISTIPGMNEVAQAALGVSAAFARELKMDVDPAKSRLQMWLSVMRKGGFHGIHNHPGSVVSGTFYVQCNEKSAPLMLMNPTRHLRMHEPRPQPQDMGPFTSEQLMMKPEAGQMIVWPSWVDHHVMRHDDDQPRVAISFNVDYNFMPDDK